MTSSEKLLPHRDSSFPDSYITLAEEILAPLFPFLADTALKYCKEGRGLPARVLDIGGGTGQWLNALSEKGSFFGVLVDTDPEMLFHARTRLARNLPSERFAIVHADAQALPFAHDCLDLIVSRNSMHMWPNLPRCWQEIFRVLAHGGTAFIGRGYGPDLPESVRRSIKEQRKQFRRKAGESATPEPLSPEASEIQSLCLNSGFATVRVVPDGKAYWVVAHKG